MMQLKTRYRMLTDECGVVRDDLPEADRLIVEALATSLTSLLGHASVVQELDHGRSYGLLLLCEAPSIDLCAEFVEQLSRALILPVHEFTRDGDDRIVAAFIPLGDPLLRSAAEIHGLMRLNVLAAQFAEDTRE